MIRLIFCLPFLLLFTHIIQAQNGKELKRALFDSLEMKYKVCLKRKSIVPLVQFFEAQPDSVKVDEKFLFAYYGSRVGYFDKTILRSLKELDSSSLAKDNQFGWYLKEINKAQESCGECSICALEHKYETFQTLKIKHQFPTNEKQSLLTAGYKETKNGLGITAKYQNIGRPYYGLELLFGAQHQPSYKLRVKDTITGLLEHVCGNSLDFIPSIASVGFNYNPGDRRYQTIINLLAFHNPIVLRLFQFGVDYSPKKNVFFYRPELGIGHNGFHISAGYNVVMKDSLRSYVDKWVWSAGYSYVFNTL